MGQNIRILQGFDKETNVKKRIKEAKRISSPLAQLVQMPLIKDPLKIIPQNFSLKTSLIQRPKQIPDVSSGLHLKASPFNDRIDEIQIAFLRL